MTKVFPLTPVAQAAGAGKRHAHLSPSSAFRWSVCTAAPSEEAGKPDESSEASRDGTVKHLVAAECLIHKREPAEYIGREVAFWMHPESDCSGESFLDELGAECDPGLEVMHVEEVDEDRAQAAAVFVTLVREIVEATGGELLVETKLPIGHITGEEGATGTGDVIIICRALRRIIVIDLKGGRNKVDAYRVVSEADSDAFTGEPVPAVTTPNLQLALYGLGALEEVTLFGDEFDTVTMMIVQPALDHVSEYTVDLAQLDGARVALEQAAEATRSNPTYAPDADRCAYCKGLQTCGAVSGEVLQAVFNIRALDQLTPAALPINVPARQLGLLYEKLGLIEDWCKAIRSRVRSEIEAGQEVIGAKEAYRLGEGKNGARKWRNPAEAERVLREVMRLTADQAYTRKLISPTKAEVLTKGDAPPIGKRQWTKLQTLIGQDKGRPVIVPMSSKRPPVALATADDFDDVSDPQPVALDDDPFTP